MLISTYKHANSDHANTLMFTSKFSKFVYLFFSQCKNSGGWGQLVISWILIHNTNNKKNQPETVCRRHVCHVTGVLLGVIVWSLQAVSLLNWLNATVWPQSWVIIEVCEPCIDATHGIYQQFYSFCLFRDAFSAILSLKFSLILLVDKPNIVEWPQDM